MPGSTAETVHGRRGGGWLPKERKLAPMAAREVYGSPDHCATCGRKQKCVAIARDPKRPTSGRWHVCASCRRTGISKGCKLTYEDIR